MTGTEWMEKTLPELRQIDPWWVTRDRRPRAVCSDGFSLSIQGNTATHYCYPREYVDWAYEVEIGYPSEREELLMKYAEDPDSPTDTVYAYVPMDVVDAVVEKHGGIVEAEHGE